MRIILTILIGLFLLIGYPSKTPKVSVVQATPTEDSVLICDSPNAYAYHNRWCAGLQKCTHDVYKVSFSDAVKEGKGKPCGNCY